MTWIYQLNNKMNLDKAMLEDNKLTIWKNHGFDDLQPGRTVFESIDIASHAAVFAFILLLNVAESQHVRVFTIWQELF